MEKPRSKKGISGVAELRDEFLRNWDIPEFKIVN
jgi:hypothetical protein